MRIIVGMSGGVDSSVAAFLLKQQGVDVHGLFMKNWEQDDTELYCHSAEDVVDAKQVADTIGIPITSANFAKEYWERVFKHFIAEYKAGRTPNPDILCNTEIKFKAFLDHAKTLGADKIATGHYARVIEKDGEFQLHKALDLNKDQSYFLHGLRQAQLSQAMFPLGEISKPTVRKIAAEQGFKNADKKDSTGICFIGERKFKTFLQDYLPAQQGDMIIIDTGKVIGHHDGLMYYTIGQRQGLGIGGIKDASEEPWYVVAKDLEKNQLLVAQGEHPALYKQSLQLESIHWIGKAPALPYNCMAKCRYRQPDQHCTITKTETGFEVTFEKPQRAITPGQSVVFYEGTQCLGGGVIL